MIDIIDDKSRAKVAEAMIDLARLIMRGIVTPIKMELPAIRAHANGVITREFHSHLSTTRD